MEQFNTNTALNFVPPRTLIDAMSEIQQYYLIEQTGEPLQKDFFTMTHVMGFSMVGIKTAFIDSVIWISGYVFLGGLIYYLQQHYITEVTTDIYFWKIPGSPFYLFSKMASFGHIIYSTVLCIMISKYYTGTVPKRAVNCIFITRSMFLICFSLVTFLILAVFYKMLMNDNILNNLYTFLARFNAKFSENIYLYITQYFRRLLFESSIVSLLSSSFSIVVPFLSISLFRVLKKRKKDLGIEVT